MDRQPGSVDLNQLLAESGWVTQLVARLLGDSHAAEEVVQETWLRALKRPPRSEPGTPSQRAWIARVARRIALRRMASDAARKRREEQVAVRESTDPGKALDRVRLQRELADRVLDLREPYRMAVILRFFDGLGSAELAQRLEISEAAARKRVSRGIQLLREEYDRRYGDRTSWCAALLPLARRGTPTGVGEPGAAGATAVTGTSGLPTVASWTAVVVLVGSLGAWWMSDSLPGSAPAEQGTVLESSRLESQPAEPQQDGPIRLPLTGPDASGGVAVKPLDEGAGQAESRGGLWGQVSDEEGDPVVGALVTATEPDRSAFALMERRPAADRIPAETAVTDDEGGFSLSWPLDQLADLRVEKSSRGTEQLIDQQVGGPIEVRLGEPARLALTVVEQGTETGLPGLRFRVLRWWPENRTFRQVHAGTTDAEGRIDLPDLPGGRHSLELVGVTHSDLVTAFDLEPGEDEERILGLEPALRLEGVIRDGRTSEPLAGARVVAGPGRMGPGAGELLPPESIGSGFRNRPAVTTDMLGRFSVLASRGPEPIQLTCTAPGYGMESVTIEHPRPETPVEIELVAGFELSGRIVGRGGAPLPGLRVVAAANLVQDECQRVDWRETISDLDGRFRLDDLRQGVHHDLTIEGAHTGRVTYRLAASGEELDRLELGQIILDPAGRVSGSVCMAAGSPCPEIYVSLSVEELPEAADSNLGGATQPLERLASSARITRADPHGHFVFPRVPPGRYLLEPAGEHAGGASRIVTVSPGVESAGLVLELVDRRVIAGMVHDIGGEPILNALVLLRSPGSATSRPRTCMTDRQGRFTFGSLNEESYSLSVAPNSIHLEGGDRSVHAISMDHVLAGDQQVDVLLPPAVEIRGRVIDAAGDPRVGRIVFAHGPDGSIATYETIATDGSFVLRLPPEAVVDLVIGPPPGTEPALRGVEAGRADILIVDGD